jgi:acyl dehydratase
VKLTSRTFDHDDQLQFARASGDHNDVHIDPISARRSIVGRQVVHGVHLVLWAIDGFLSTSPRGVERITASFRKPVFLDENVELHANSDDKQTARLAVSTRGTKLMDVILRLGEGGPSTDDARSHLTLSTQPAELSISEMAGMRGTLLIPRDDEWLSTQYPSAFHHLGGALVAQLGAVSRLVGMICPGRHSLLSSIDVTVDHDGDPLALDWEVTRADQRVSIVQLKVSGGRIDGEVQAFSPPRPATQATTKSLQGVVPSSAFADQRALVVGGSRGLGELTAKLLAAGGADVLLTWHRGRLEAEAVVADILEAGGRAQARELDIADPSPVITEMASAGWAASHVYYYATPRISSRRMNGFDHLLFEEFCRAYVGGFVNVVESCLAESGTDLGVLYPSSIAVEGQLEGLIEYGAAKGAGEVCAALMSARQSKLRVLAPRLPRLPTDQTASILPQQTADPVQVLVPILQAMNQPG